MIYFLLSCFLKDSYTYSQRYTFSMHTESLVTKIIHTLFILKEKSSGMKHKKCSWVYKSGERERERERERDRQTDRQRETEKGRSSSTLSVPSQPLPWPSYLPWQSPPPALIEPSPPPPSAAWRPEWPGSGSSCRWMPRWGPWWSPPGTPTPARPSCLSPGTNQKIKDHRLL